MPYFDEIMGKASGESRATTSHSPVSSTAFPKYVASRTLREPLEWNNSHLLKGDVADAVRKLKEEDGGDVMVLGSGDLAQTLMANGLIDVYDLWVDPIVLGTGKRLFREGIPKVELELVGSATSSTGVAMHTYRPAKA